jgi:hypothetical protein
MRKRSLLAPADTSALRIASPTTFLNDPSDEVAPPAPFLNDSASVGFDVGGLRGEGAFPFGAFAGVLLACCDPPCAAVVPLVVGASPFPAFAPVGRAGAASSVGFDVGGLRGEGAFAFGAFAGELLACVPPGAAVPLSAFLPGDARPTSSFFDGV